MSDWDYDDRPESYSRNYHAVGHVMNKDEARVMRQLKAKTGLSEKEIRQEKKYRILLSTAQKQGRKKKTELSIDEQLKENVIKSVCKDVGLARNHPDTLDLCWFEWNYRQHDGSPGYSLYYGRSNPFPKPA